MSENLPANVPARPTKETALQRNAAPDSAALSTITHALPSIPGMVLTRRHLAHFVRFASRVTARSATPGLRCCLFGADSAVVTDLVVSLRTILPGARDIGVLIPVDVLKRSINSSDRPEIHIVRELTNPSRPFGVRVDEALITGHDPEEFPAVGALFPDGHSVAHARFAALEPVLVAASTDERDRSKCGVFFQLCKNVVVGTNSHVLHAVAIEGSGEGDFLVPRKAIEIIEIIRKATKTREVTVAFHADHAVFRIAQFELSARLEKGQFPAWQEVVPKASKHELRVSKHDLLRALDRVAAAIGDRARGVVLHRSGDRLEIYGEKPEAGELKTDIAASGWTDKAMIEVNLSYLHCAVRYVPSDDLRIGVTDETSPMKIEDGSYLALVMPIAPTKGNKP
jgi:DNA polymerase-3 subunit beta